MYSTVDFLFSFPGAAVTSLRGIVMAAGVGRSQNDSVAALAPASAARVVLEGPVGGFLVVFHQNFRDKCTMAQAPSTYNRPFYK